MTPFLIPPIIFINKHSFIHPTDQTGQKAMLSKTFLLNIGGGQQKTPLPANPPKRVPFFILGPKTTQPHFLCRFFYGSNKGYFRENDTRWHKKNSYVVQNMANPKEILEKTT